MYKTYDDTTATHVIHPLQIQTLQKNGSSPGPPEHTEHRPTFFMQRQAKNSTFHFKVLGFCGAFSVLPERFKKANSSKTAPFFM